MISWMLVIGSMEFLLEDSRCFLISYFMNVEDGLMSIYLEYIDCVEFF